MLGLKHNKVPNLFILNLLRNIYIFKKLDNALLEFINCFLKLTPKFLVKLNPRGGSGETKKDFLKIHNLIHRKEEIVLFWREYNLLCKS
jgi:hypothetical protein